ncbi:MAG: hypothetical protein AAGC92_11470 [Pseudomonadota bacterium]
MADLAMETPFGGVLLGASTASAGAVAAARPALPEEMRVDGCRIGTLQLAVTPSDAITVMLTADLVTGAVARPAPDAWLAAWEVETEGLVGAFGMRDAEWLAGKYGLRQTGFSDRNPGVALFLEARAPGVAGLACAAAWTAAPVSEAERFAAWCALDHVLPR